MVKRSHGVRSADLDVANLDGISRRFDRKLPCNAKAN